MLIRIKKIDAEWRLFFQCSCITAGFLVLARKVEAIATEIRDQGFFATAPDYHQSQCIISSLALTADTAANGH